MYCHPAYLTFVIHTVRGFGIFNKAEMDVFLELSCFFYDTTDVGNKHLLIVLSKWVCAINIRNVEPGFGGKIECEILIKNLQPRKGVK